MFHPYEVEQSQEGEHVRKAEQVRRQNKAGGRTRQEGGRAKRRPRSGYITSKLKRTNEITPVQIGKGAQRRVVPAEVSSLATPGGSHSHSHRGFSPVKWHIYPSSRAQARRRMAVPVARRRA